MKYAVITYNFNNYEIMRDIPDCALDPDIEYLYITDDTSLKSKNWKIIIDHDLDDLSPFDKCYSVRFNLFKYTDAEYVMYIDGSIQILQNPKIYFTRFLESKCDLSICVHPGRATLFKEYFEWVKSRNYDAIKAYSALFYMQELGYDIRNYKGLYQGGFRIIKNTDTQKQLDKDCYDILKELGGETIERLDQTIYSFLLNTKYKNLKLLPYNDSCIFSNYLNVQGHNQKFSFKKHPKNRPYIKQGYVRNELVNLLGI